MSAESFDIIDRSEIPTDKEYDSAVDISSVKSEDNLCGCGEEKVGKALKFIWGHTKDSSRLYFRLCGNKNLYSIANSQIISLAQSGQCHVPNIGWKTRFELWHTT